MQVQGQTIAASDAPDDGRMDALADVRTLPELLRFRVRLTPDAPAYRHFDARLARWVDHSWREIDGEFDRWRRALIAERLDAGERVAILMPNGIAHISMDQAALSRGLVPVPMHAVDNPDSIAYILHDSGASLLFLDTLARWQAIAAAGQPSRQLKRVVCASLQDPSGLDSRVVALDRWLEGAADVAGEDVNVQANDLAAIVYTSGTTGRPKGVMLSHENVVSNVKAIHRRIAASGQDIFLSFLPLSHTFERTCGYYLQVMTGATVAYARSVPLLSEDFLSIRPTILISVPRIYERIYGAINARLNEGSAFRRSLFHFAVETGWARFLHQQGRGRWRFSFLLWPLLNKLVAQKVLGRLGGRLRSAISGGAALAPDVARMFVGLGLQVVQGYGMTETSPIVCGNSLDNNFPESVGRPIRNVQVKLGEQGALMVKGPNVMMGYWRNPEATAAIVDAEGWLNTGDIAHISDTGHIYITGRLKEIIVLSNGEKIPPADMEAAILNDPLIDQVMICGEGKPYLVALAVLNPEVWPQVAAKVGVRPEMPESLTDSNVEAKVLRRIARNISTFPGYAKVHRVLLLTAPWNIDNGLLTPKMSLRRNKVVEVFGKQIDDLYKGH